MRPAFHNIIGLLWGVILAGCTAIPTHTEPTTEHLATYACDHGETLEIRFFPLQGVGVLVRHGKTMELQQQVSGSGFIYSNGPNTVRGKGDELIVEIGRMVPFKCRVVNH